MGIVTDIQRFSLNDGPGIRTTVFFKGCNLACAWCHNPETLSQKIEWLIHPEKCGGCGACVADDPALAREGLPPAREHLNEKRAGACFSGALSTAGREVSVRDVMFEIEQDVTYYQTSGGGVTLSGGEAMTQPAFARELLEACKEKGIPAALETNLAYDFSVLAEILPLLHLVMADIKLMDDEKHRALTGASNATTLENVRKLADTEVPYILRTPLIPGVNDAPDEIRAIAAYAARNRRKPLYYELLNFNPLGASKYSGLSVDNPFRAARPLPKDRIEELKNAALSQGIPVRVG